MGYKPKKKKQDPCSASSDFEMTDPVGQGTEEGPQGQDFSDLASWGGTRWGGSFLSPGAGGPGGPTY